MNPLYSAQNISQYLIEKVVKAIQGVAPYGTVKILVTDNQIALISTERTEKTPIDKREK